MFPLSSYNTNQSLNFIEWLKLRKDIIKEMLERNENGNAYISKWWPIITKNIQISVKDNESIRLISIFCELISAYDQYLNQYNPYNPLSKENEIVNNHIKNFLSELSTYLSKKENPRVKIIGKVYNYTTGSIEYELSDGNFIKILDNNKVDGPIKKFNISEFFPSEFLKIVSISHLRENKISEILK